MCVSMRETDTQSVRDRHRQRERGTDRHGWSLLVSGSQRQDMKAMDPRGFSTKKKDESNEARLGSMT